MWTGDSIKTAQSIGNQWRARIDLTKLWIFMFSSAYWIKQDRLAARSMGNY
jgi:hypothetical protein